jgi:hypothetical protein
VSAPLVQKFARLKAAEVERLEGFFAGPAVLVRGLDKREWGPYRGGCLPWIGALVAGVLGFAGEGMGMPGPVAVGLGLSAAVLATTSIVRTAVAARRSRRLLARDEGWVGLAWTAQEFCLRTFDLCVLVPWSAVTKVEYLPPEEGSILGDTLWIHVEGGDKALIEPFDGTFGGRPIGDWARDVEGVWKRVRR